MTDWSPAEDAWFAGFTDGEGSFMLLQHKEGRICPRFQILLRADELPLLEQFKTTFGGYLHLQDRANEPSSPTVSWQVNSGRELARLVAYFDRFPLRAKKARDYAIWRRAISVYCRDGSRAAELPILRLREGRAFTASDTGAEMETTPDRPQLRLIANA